MREKRAACAELFFQPAVHHLLDFPSGIAKLGEADHTTAAFQRMEAASDVSERLRVLRLRTRDYKGSFDRRQHLGGLFQEDLQQLAGLSGWCGLRRCRRRGWRPLVEALEEGVDRLLARLAPFEARRNEKANAAQAFGDPVHVFAARRQGNEEPLAALQGADGAIPAQHRQRAVDLSQLWHQRLHDFVRALTARIRIEHLLDLLQVGDDLAGDLRAQLNRADLLEKLRTQTCGWRSAGLAACRGA